MPWFRKPKKSRQPSQQPGSLGIPTHIAAGPLGFSVVLSADGPLQGTLRLIEIQQPMGLIVLWRQV